MDSFLKMRIQVQKCQPSFPYRHTLGSRLHSLDGLLKFCSSLSGEYNLTSWQFVSGWNLLEY